MKSAGFGVNMAGVYLQGLVWASESTQLCKPLRADPEEPSEVPAGRAALETAAERVPPRSLRPPLRLRLLPPTRVRRVNRVGARHPQAARPAGRRAGAAVMVSLKPREDVKVSMSQHGSFWVWTESSPAVSQQCWF